MQITAFSVAYLKTEQNGMRKTYVVIMIHMLTIYIQRATWEKVGELLLFGFLFTLAVC